MTGAEIVKAIISLVTILVPFLERYAGLFPVNPRIRAEALPVAVFASIACVVAGYVTARRTTRGLVLGWIALVLFLLATVTLFLVGITAAWVERPVYVLVFALFSLTVSAFLGHK